MPMPFYLSCFLLVVLGGIAWNGRWHGWGTPMGMVLATVGAWYVGDVLYNNFDEYRAMLGDETITAAWWQVCWFLACFGVFVPLFHHWINHRYEHRRSRVMAYVTGNRLQHPQVQMKLDAVAEGLFVLWALLMAVALIQVKGDVAGLFAPYLGEKVNPWARGQIGGGFSALISFASYLQILLVGAVGVIAALAMNPRIRLIAIVICVLAMPYYIFDRTRNTMIATLLPGILAYVLIRFRYGWLARVGLLVAVFLFFNFWFKVVLANREGMALDMENVVEGKTREGEDVEEVHHEGLNMFEELAWIQHFRETGAYVPNMGQRYFAELVNPIPRGLWKNKPMIGLDYAVARGQAAIGENGEVTATISTGMIGQGVVNFGSVGGPLAAAALMALWVSSLARQDLLGDHAGRLILYGCGLLLTFNLGRDITLLVMYPYFFGLVVLNIHDWYRKNMA